MAMASFLSSHFRSRAAANKAARNRDKADRVDVVVSRADAEDSNRAVDSRVPAVAADKIR